MSGRPLIQILRRISAAFLSPGVCIACGCEIEHDQSLCAICSQQLRYINNPCDYCAEPNPVDGTVCPRCLLNPPRWQKMLAPFEYRGLVRDYLIQLKFNQALQLARTLCQQSYSSFRQTESYPEVLLPVPLHRQRLLDRGFNQALEIATHWSTEFEIPLDRQALTRQSQTESQSGLSANLRGINVQGAFAYSPKERYRHVALVDDIVTTGSTVSEISKLLHRAGVEYVEVWALARVYRR